MRPLAASASPLAATPPSILATWPSRLRGRIPSPIPGMAFLSFPTPSAAWPPSPLPLQGPRELEYRVLEKHRGDNGYRKPRHSFP